MEDGTARMDVIMGAIGHGTRMVMIIVEAIGAIEEFARVERDEDSTEEERKAAMVAMVMSDNVRHFMMAMAVMEGWTKDDADLIKALLAARARITRERTKGLLDDNKNDKRKVNKKMRNKVKRKR